MMNSKRNISLEIPKNIQIETYQKTVNNAKDYINEIASSKLMLAAVVLYSLSLFVKLIDSVRGTSLRKIIDYLYDLRIYEYNSRVYDFFRNGVTFGNVMTKIIWMLPSILVAVGLWIIIIQSRNQSMGETTGFKFIRIEKIVFFILKAIPIALFILLFLVIFITESDYFGYTITKVLFFYYLFVIIYWIVFKLLFDWKVIKLLKNVENVINMDEPASPASLLLLIVIILAAIGHFVFNVVFGLYLYGLLSLASDIIFVIMIIKYNESVRALERGMSVNLNVSDVKFNGDIQESSYVQNIYADNSYEEKTVNCSENAASLPNAKLLHVNGNQLIPINKSSLIIGKDARQTDYAIENNPLVSRKHIKILFENGMYYLRDLNSTNHTYINGMMVNPEQNVILNNEDQIYIANESLIFKLV